MAQPTVRLVHTAQQFHAAGKLAEAEGLYRQALASDPTNLEALYGLGVIASQMGSHEEAVRLLRPEVVGRTTNPQVYLSLGLSLRGVGRLDDAIACWRRVTELSPDSAVAYNNLGTGLFERGRIEEALAAYRMAIALQPEYAEAHYNLGATLHHRRDLENALTSYRRAVELKPAYAEAQRNLACALKDLGRVEEAVKAYRDTLAIKPDFAKAQEDLIFAMQYHPDCTSEDILREQKAWAQRFAEPMRTRIQPHENSRGPDRRLRIGYVSSDFCEHVVAWNILPLFRAHDRTRFEIFCYAAGRERDRLTEKFQGLADQWREIGGVSDDQAADMIRADGIDILVDLSVHSEGNRLLVFARKPAPVQVTFAGYPGGTGLAAIDYRLSDPHLDPPGSDGNYVERTVRLPHSFWCYDPLAMEVAGLPAAGAPPALVTGHITFGCLNIFAKLNAGVLRMWGRVLEAVPGSRLIALAPPGKRGADVIDALANAGIESSRIELMPRMPRIDYFNVYQRIDIALDTVPYNGHTTSLDALWMGVPVVTLVGRTVVGRAGLSQLMNLGLTELIARTEEEFVHIAAGLTLDLRRLGELRGGLRERMRNSPLTDGADFTRAIEAAYRQMWQSWCAETPSTAPQPASAKAAPPAPRPPRPAQRSVLSPQALAQQVQTALQFHAAGKFAEAETLYRKILASDPANFDAHCGLGVVASQLGRHQEAVALLRPDIAARSPNPLLHLSRGIALRAVGRLDEAIASSRRAVQLAPQYPDAHNNLGNALRDKGLLDEAATELRTALRLRPVYPEAQFTLGMIARAKGDLDVAAQYFRQALAARPKFDEAGAMLREVLAERACNREREAGATGDASSGDAPGAGDRSTAGGSAPSDPQQHLPAAPAPAIAPSAMESEHEPAIPKSASAAQESAQECFRQGHNLARSGRLEEAAAAFSEAVRLKPDYTAAVANLGVILGQLGRGEESLAACQRAAALMPNSAPAHNNLGNALRMLGRIPEAAAAFCRAVTLQNDYVEAHYNLGLAYSDLHLPDEAAASFRRAVTLKSDHVEAHRQLGLAVAALGQVEEGISHLERAVALKRDDAAVHSDLVYLMSFHPGYDGSRLATELTRWRQQHAVALCPTRISHANDRAPDRRLRIGYVSPDFRAHVVGINLLPLMRHHDHKAFEIHCYASVPKPDHITGFLRGYADAWHDVRALDDAALAERIRADQIDILVDLTLHMGDNRLLVFARKPAPVQLTYLGYCGSTGLETMDYRLSDPHLDPEGVDLSCYTEETLRLPRTYWCYETGWQAPDPAPLPALARGYVTFGCLNSFMKVSPAALELWSEILATIPDSRLLLCVRPGPYIDEILRPFIRRGIAGNRIEFVAWQPRQQYLETYGRIDIALDPFPYGGGITTCDGLWMGVPAVTLSGQSAVGRAGRSILTNMGLPELMAHDAADYVRIASELGRDLTRLSALRASLRGRLRASPLLDARQLAIDIEAAYRQIWQRWCTTGE